MGAKQRYIHFDVLKGIAILLVILGHVYLFSWGQYNVALLYWILTSIHMPLFVTLSGFFMGKNLDLTKRGIVTFWIGKAIRLLLPLLFVPIFFDWIRYGISAEVPLKAMFMEYWFTSALFGLMVLLYIFKALVEPRVSHPYILAGSAIIWCVVVSFALSVVHDRLNINLLQMQLSKLYWLFPFLTLGYLMGRTKAIENWVRDERIGAIAFAVYLGYLWYWYVYIGGNVAEVPLLLSMSGVIACYSLAYNGCTYLSLVENAKPASWLIKILAYLGQVSLPIYLTHYFFLPAMPWIKDFLQEISYKPQIFAWEFALGALGVLMVLIPTLLTIRIVMCNKYLAMFLYGEKIKRVREVAGDIPL